MIPMRSSYSIMEASDQGTGVGATTGFWNSRDQALSLRLVSALHARPTLGASAPKTGCGPRTLINQDWRRREIKSVAGNVRRGEGPVTASDCRWQLGWQTAPNGV